ncbi:RIP metalloprotease RseP [Dethiosulfovibrio salsuginis]|uniref:Zinc metalloprotease n=1 Tax=Dethiosulfovibrio salsuginis TaxID=561720 RepID=A0A1X7I3B3_9BACT|nr:RIP metalloprotease RseP [Dethiosulfovibrio salsuginis]SMG08961.1 regulator of sigma E protease [Dethiosulfovibrio salsuginis]
MVSILSFVLIIAVCVVIHEYGHYRTAIAMGIQVHEFAFGMGPVIFSKKGKRNIWSVRLFPIGGFVRLAGMEEEESQEVSCPGMGFNEKSPWARLSVLIAGPASNVFLAFLLTALLLGGQGVLNMETPTVGSIMAGYPSDLAGIRPGDVIISVNGESVSDWSSMAQAIRNSPLDDPLALIILREGREINMNVEITDDPVTGFPLLGIQPGRIRYSPLKAINQSMSYTFHMSTAMIKGIGEWIFGKTEVDVSGPIGIASMAGDAAKQGLWPFISFLAIISLNLGIINLFPFPALDGGRIIFILGEIVTGKRLSQAIEGYIHFAGFVLLIGLILFITWQDVMKLL